MLEMGENYPLIELRGLSAGYGRKVLVAGAMAQVRAGEMVTLLGANGAGKSTLLKTVCGEIAPLCGEAFVGGRNTRKVSRQELAKLLAVVNTDRVEADGLTVRELVGMGRYPYTGFFGRLDREDYRIVDEALEAVGMSEYASRGVSSLSDGERQKTMVARALAQSTPVIVLDEPTAFLDVASRVELNALLCSLAQKEGKAVLMTSHDVAQALEQSSRVWLLTGDGKLTDASTGELIAAHESHREGSPLDLLFKGRAVEFDARRLDYRAKLR